MAEQEIDKQLSRLQRKVDREKTARSEAERMLEEKSKELYYRNRELEILSDSLEQKVQKRTIDLEKARDEALAANRAKSAFLANMSHEIRTPLTAILGHADNINKGYYDKNKSQNALGRIISNGEHLLKLINDILDISKIESNHLTVERLSFSPTKLLEEVQSLIQNQADSKSLQLTLLSATLPDTIQSDPTRVKQIVLNLCSNAVKFTENGGVTIEAKYVADSNQLQIAIADTGIGIETDKLDKIFKPFEQADESTTRKFGGTGLGLYISQQLSQLLGGDLQVSSTLGQGTTFTMAVNCGAINLANQYNVQTQTTSDDIPQLSGNILLVEDTLVNQELISFNIKLTGANLDLAENGQEAVEKALQNKYDLVLMDIQMPIMDGKQAMEMLSSLGYQDPVYALTANVMTNDLQEYSALGFQGSLAKPLENDKFYAVLTKHLKKATLGQTVNHSEPDITEQIKDKFYAELYEYMFSLKAALQTQSWHLAKSTAHKIKGSAANFGLVELGKVADQVQKAALVNDEAECAKLTMTLKQLLRQALTDYGYHV